MRLQHEVDALAPSAANGGRDDRQGTPASALRGAATSRSNTDTAAAADEAMALAAATTEELASARASVTELQAQSDRGVALIERLKLRLEKQEKDKEAQSRRERELQANLRETQQQVSHAQLQLRQRQSTPQQPSRSGGGTAGIGEQALRTRHESEMKVLVSEVDALQAKASQNEINARMAANELRVMSQRAIEAEKARDEAQARAASAEAAAQKASSGTVALLKAALCESQRRLQTTRKALDAAATAASASAAVAARGGTDDEVRSASQLVGTPMPERVPSPRSLPTRAPPDAEPMATQDGGLPGLGRLRASLLDSLRAERSKLERERALLDRQ